MNFTSLGQFLFHRTRRSVLSKKQNITEAATRLLSRPGFKFITDFQQFVQFVCNVTKIPRLEPKRFN